MKVDLWFDIGLGGHHENIEIDILPPVGTIIDPLEFCPDEFIQEFLKNCTFVENDYFDNNTFSVKYIYMNRNKRKKLPLRY